MWRKDHGKYAKFIRRIYVYEKVEYYNFHMIRHCVQPWTIWNQTAVSLRFYVI
jgi:hypothetical protein